MSAQKNYLDGGDQPNLNWVKFFILCASKIVIVIPQPAITNTVTCSTVRT